jgi:hypothetical protein
MIRRPAMRNGSSGYSTSSTPAFYDGERSDGDLADARDTCRPSMRATVLLLWKTNLGAQMLNNPITYAVNGKQYIAAAAGLSLFVFALP